MIEIAVIVTLLASGLGLSTPLLFAALGEKIAERAGVLNLGVEGMMIMGAFAGFMGAFITENIAVGFLFAILTGAVMAGLMAFLNVTHGRESGSEDNSVRRKTSVGPSYWWNSSPYVQRIDPDETDRCIEFPKLHDFQSR